YRGFQCDYFMIVEAACTTDAMGEAPNILQLQDTLFTAFWRKLSNRKTQSMPKAPEPSKRPPTVPNALQPARKGKGLPELPQR
ncbi:Hypothetical predicted protein, partial [Pelobates cultripes]